MIQLNKMDNIKNTRYRQIDNEQLAYVKTMFTGTHDLSFNINYALFISKSRNRIEKEWRFVANTKWKLATEEFLIGDADKKSLVIFKDGEIRIYN